MGTSAFVSLLFATAFLLAGCPRAPGPSEESVAQQGLQDADAAVDFYLKASKDNPHNAHYRLRLDQARFQAAQQHLQQGRKQREQGALQAAVAEFQRAQVLDPSSATAGQELKKTVDLLREQLRSTQAQTSRLEESQTVYASHPPELKPLSRAPVNLKMTADARIVFDTIGKLAGITVVYDPDLQGRRITTELNNVTLEQALGIVCLESKAFWKPLTENILMIFPDQTQKRRDYEEQEVRTFYLNNIAIPQDLTELTTGLRQLLDLKRIQQINAQSAIIIRDTPDKLALVEKIISDIDKSKPEVLIQMEVLQARTDKLRDLGIQPPQTASVAINPNYGSSSSSSSSSNGISSLGQLGHLNQNEVVFTLPTATANFLLTDSATKIIDNPEIRALDGQPAKLRVGDRVPVATGSFQAGTGAGTSGVNPLVNTQFQYIDVGVSLDVTPHVHGNREISMKLVVEVSSVTGYATIGGIQQPIISQRKIEHEIRLREGEVSILGGLFERVDSKTLDGWPGLANVPIMRYLFSADKLERDENENLIVLIPHIVRMPDWSVDNLRAIYSGTETSPGAKKITDVQAPSANPAP
jgi:general secretion pathway protein D